MSRYQFPVLVTVSVDWNRPSSGAAFCVKCDYQPAIHSVSNSLIQYLCLSKFPTLHSISIHATLHFHSSILVAIFVTLVELASFALPQ